jgi:hypothetical protein
MGRKKDRHQGRSLIRINGQTIWIGQELDRAAVEDYLALVERLQHRHYDAGHHQNGGLTPAEELFDNGLSAGCLAACLKAMGIIPTSISEHHEHLERSTRGRERDRNQPISPATT